MGVQKTPILARYSEDKERLKTLKFAKKVIKKKGHQHIIGMQLIVHLFRIELKLIQPHLADMVQVKRHLQHKLLLIDQ